MGYAKKQKDKAISNIYKLLSRFLNEHCVLSRMNVIHEQRANWRYYPLKKPHIGYRKQDYIARNYKRNLD